MRETLIFDYYYGKEAEQFSFYRIPRMLIKDAHFSSLSNDAKILYGLKHSVTVIRLIEIAAVLDIHPAKLLEYTYSVNSGRSDEVFH